MSIRKANQVVKFLGAALESVEMAEIKVMTANIQCDKSNTKLIGELTTLKNIMYDCHSEVYRVLTLASMILTNETAAYEAAKSDAAMIAAAPVLHQTTKK